MAAAKAAKREAGCRSRKTRIYPNAEQREYAKLLFEAWRYAKNVAVEHINRQKTWKDVRELYKLIGLDGGSGYPPSMPERFNTLPKAFFELAMQQAAKDAEASSRSVASAAARRRWKAEARAKRADIELGKVPKPAEHEPLFTDDERTTIKAKVSTDIERSKESMAFQFSRKKDPKEMILLPSRCLNRKNGYMSMLFGGPKTRSAMRCEKGGNPIPETFTHAAIMTHDRRRGEYHLCVQYAIPEAIDPVPRTTVLSTDPGVKTYLTVYDVAGGRRVDIGPSGRMMSLGLGDRKQKNRSAPPPKNDESRKSSTARELRHPMSRAWGWASAMSFLTRKAHRLEASAKAATRMVEQKHADELAQRNAAFLALVPPHGGGVQDMQVDAHPHPVSELRKTFMEAHAPLRRDMRRARRAKRRAARAWERRENLSRDMIRRAVRALCAPGVGLILLPDFSPRSKVERSQIDALTGKAKRRAIGNRTAERMMGQCHARLRDALACECEKVGCRVELVREDYTTKTCGRCGGTYDINASPDRDAFRCPRCGWACPRDLNGARNVLLRYAVEKLPQ